LNDAALRSCENSGEPTPWTALLAVARSCARAAADALFGHLYGELTAWPMLQFAAHEATGASRSGESTAPQGG
jgi:hypothetical protein